MKRLTDVQYWEEAWWKRHSPERLRLYRDFDYETVRLLRNAASAVQRTTRADPIRVLEAGAGGSRVLPYLGRKFGYRVFGSDFSLSGCRLLRANLALQKIEGGVVCEDLFASSLSTGSFDLVFSSGLVEHFDDTRAALAEHLKVLKPGGKLVIIIPNFQGLQGRIWKRLAPTLWSRHRIFGPQDLAGYLKDLGARDVRSGYLGSFLVHIERGPDWTLVNRWPRWFQFLAYYFVRLANGLISLLFRLSPLRPHSRATSPAFYAMGAKSEK